MQSESFVVSTAPDEVGMVLVGITVPPPFVMETPVLIDGQKVFLSGAVNIECCSLPAPIEGLELCGALIEEPTSCRDIRMGVGRGYVVRLFATPAM
jgi:hypothetical protein